MHGLFGPAPILVYKRELFVSVSFVQHSLTTSLSFDSPHFQKIVFVRCGCPVPDLSADWKDANIIHIPVSSVMVQMPNTLGKIYLMGQGSKVAAIESNRYISDATPEIATDIRDGIIRRLDLSPNGKPSTMVTLSFSSGRFHDESAGFRLQLVDDNSTVVRETSCAYPTSSDSTKPLNDIMDDAFNSVPAWVDAGKVWVLTNGGGAQAEPSTSLSYTLYFDNQLSMDFSLRGESTSCGRDVEFDIKRDFAPSKHPSIPSTIAFATYQVDSQM
mmetsp:Transcript_21150/g.58799  ORF Transcript_21150/g.58799 Transcript_21150/m.58799 type:complete len:272 (+) Transcript_21150:1770-2585(+)